MHFCIVCNNFPWPMGPAPRKQSKPSNEEALLARKLCRQFTAFLYIPFFKDALTKEPQGQNTPPWRASCNQTRDATLWAVCATRLLCMRTIAQSMLTLGDSPQRSGCSGIRSSEQLSNQLLACGWLHKRTLTSALGGSEVSPAPSGVAGDSGSFDPAYHMWRSLAPFSEDKSVSQSDLHQSQVYTQLRHRAVQVRSRNMMLIWNSWESKTLA